MRVDFLTGDFVRTSILILFLSRTEKTWFLHFRDCRRRIGTGRDYRRNAGYWRSCRCRLWGSGKYHIFNIFFFQIFVIIFNFRFFEICSEKITFSVLRPKIELFLSKIKLFLSKVEPFLSKVELFFNKRRTFFVKNRSIFQKLKNENFTITNRKKCQISNKLFF